MTTIQNVDTSVDILSALLWQHNNATALQTLLAKKQEWYDGNLDEFWQNWERDVFDLRTATAFGRKVWSIILGIPLTITIAPTNKIGWGFGEFNKNFNHGNFNAAQSSTIELTADEQRLVLQLRYFNLTGRYSVADINRILKFLFEDLGGVYVLDPLDMSAAVYVFNFIPGSQLLLVLREFDLMPRPSTLGVKYLGISKASFGFGAFNLNFNNGNFQAEST